MREKRVDVLAELEIYATELGRQVRRSDSVKVITASNLEPGRDSLDMYTLVEKVRRTIREIRISRRDAGLPQAIHVPEVPTEEMYHHSVFDFYSQSRNVVVGGKSTKLTPNEAKILQLLAVNENTVVTYRMIGEDVFNEDGWETGKRIKIHMNHLRKKLLQDASKNSFLQGVSSTGYILYNPASPSFEAVRASLFP